MEIVKMKKDGSLKVLDIVAINEPEGSESYDRLCNFYSYTKLKIFNYHQVTADAINGCLDETIEIKSNSLPYVTLEGSADFVKTEKYLITIND